MRIYAGDTEYTEIRISKEASSGKDCLDYSQYARALANLFRTGKMDVLPAAVGVYAPWGAGKVRLEPAGLHRNFESCASTGGACGWCAA